MLTFGERLKKVQEAIDDILTTGQSHKIDGKEYTKANLRELYELEKRYIDDVMEHGADKTSVTAGKKQRKAGVSFV